MFTILSLAHRDPRKTRTCTVEVRGRAPDPIEEEEDLDELGPEERHRIMCYF